MTTVGSAADRGAIDPDQRSDAGPVAPGDDGGVPTAGDLSPLLVLDRRMHVTTRRTWMVLLGAMILITAAIAWAVFGRAPTEVSGRSILIPNAGFYELGVEVEGTVVDHLIDPGQAVESGQAVAHIKRADGSIAEITSPVKGKIAVVLVKNGTYHEQGTPVMTIEPTDSEMVGLMYVPASAGKVIQLGMTVYQSPSTAPAAQYGSMIGTVGYVSEVPTTRDRIRLNVGNDEQLMDYLTGSGPVLEIGYSLEKDPDNPSGYAWTSGSGPPFTIGAATLGEASVVVDEQSPASRIFG
jgi:hypothetical protein